MHSPFSSNLSSLSRLRERVGVRASRSGSPSSSPPSPSAAVRCPSGRSSRTSASCSPIASCSSTPRRRSARPRSTCWPTAKAPSEEREPPAEVVVAIDDPTLRARRDLRGRPGGGAGLARPAHAATAETAVRVTMFDEPSTKNTGVRVYHPQADLSATVGVDVQRRRRLLRRRGHGRDARRVRRGVGRDQVQRHAAPGSRRRRLPARRERHLGRGRLRLGERLQVVRPLRQHLSRSVRPQLHARPRLLAQLGHRLRHRQHGSRRAAAQSRRADVVGGLLHDTIRPTPRAS